MPRHRAPKENPGRIDWAKAKRELARALEPYVDKGEIDAAVEAVIKTGNYRP